MAAAIAVPVVAVAQTKPKPESLSQRISYAIGINVGRGLRNDDVPIDFEYLVEGLRDAVDGNALLLDDAELQAAMQEMQQRAQEKRAAAGAQAKQEGERFLAENGKRSEVTTTASGLQYEVLQAGSGPSPKATDTVSVHYRGSLIDGREFDSSYARGQPANFPLNGVIAGWTEALQLMQVGAKWKLFVPAALAYGERGTPGGPIPPNSTLVFEVELLEIE